MRNEPNHLMGKALPPAVQEIVTDPAVQQKKIQDYADRYLKRHPKTSPDKLKRIVSRVYEVKIS